MHLLGSNDANALCCAFLRYLPGCRPAADHGNVLNCLQYDQQMTARDSSSCCDSCSRSLVPHSRRVHLSELGNRSPAQTHHLLLSKLGYIGCPNVSRWQASSNARRCHTADSQPTHLLMQPERRNGALALFFHLLQSKDPQSIFNRWTEC